VTFVLAACKHAGLVEELHRIVTALEGGATPRDVLPSEDMQLVVQKASAFLHT
jgi:hypothetical protein